MGITISILFHIYKPKPVTEKDANEIFLNGKRLNGFSWWNFFFFPATINGDLSGLQQALKKNVDINFRDKNSNTALMIGCKFK